ncbi:hypothetical protein [Deinococcus radiopugnans]|uniref:Uncharacterized protein n=1 Tax=Deinococcus radiopugnans ATCC 19172 TaxID=585398 RepID=A0A5C4Y7L1_9DEIO|nr:hypothetical protein [Deinococcus radiopugnans]MBB6016819.1 hypothetical protein [Deinococcus radiopugnans ATCC 19172]TNM71892.1 hypothetical protein FHR04_05865 [Deinococcus radiopugnans ATCC 19172]
MTPVISQIMKGGPAAIVLSILYGLAMLVREIRGGKVSAGQNADLVARVGALETEMQKIKDLLEEAQGEAHRLRYQRDQARVRVEYLEQLHNVQPRTKWPEEEDS